jgi:hypothetical protein
MRIPMLPARPHGGTSVSRQNSRLPWSVGESSMYPAPVTQPRWAISSTVGGSHRVTRIRSLVEMPAIRTVASASTPTPSRCSDVTRTSRISSIHRSRRSQSTRNGHTASGGPGRSTVVTT